MNIVSTHGAHHAQLVAMRRRQTVEPAKRPTSKPMLATSFSAMPRVYCFFQSKFQLVNSLVTNNAIGYNLTDAASRTETRISLTQQHDCSLSQPRAVETDGDL